MKSIVSLFTRHEAISMSDKEKEKTWEKIAARTFEVQKTSAPYVHTAPQRIQSPFFLFDKKRLATSFLISGIVFSGGVSLFAQTALPGEILYPVKVNINEKVRLAFALTPEAKANVEASLAATRLEEVEKLAVLGKLTPELAISNDENFNEHARSFEAHIATLKKQGDYQAVSTVGAFFASRIEAHQTILAQLTSTEVTTVSTKEPVDSPEIYDPKTTSLAARVVKVTTKEDVHPSVTVIVTPMVMKIIDKNVQTATTSQAGDIPTGDSSTSTQPSNITKREISSQNESKEMYITELREKVGLSATSTKKIDAPQTMFLLKKKELLNTLLKENSQATTTSAVSFSLPENKMGDATTSANPSRDDSMPYQGEGK